MIPLPCNRCSQFKILPDGKACTEECEAWQRFLEELERDDENGRRKPWEPLP